MHIVNGIAYAGETAPSLRGSGVRPFDNFRLWARFNNGGARFFDFKPLLAAPAFALFSEPETFKNFYIDHGIAVWNDGDIDISPEMLYAKGALHEGALSV